MMIVMKEGATEDQIHAVVDRVEFEVTKGPKGLQAANVRKV